MSSTLLVIGLKNSSLSSAEDGSLFLSYKLAQSYTFDEPYCAKIRQFHGSRAHLWISVDFVQPSDINGLMQPVLGSTIEGSNSWVPLITNHIPAHGWIRLSSMYEKELKREDRITLWIDIAPASQINYK